MQREGNIRAGNSIILALVLVFAVAAIGVSEGFVYQHNRTQAIYAASNSSQSTDQPTTVTPAPTVNYLTINEWGVKLPLSSAIKDAYYAPSIGSNKGTDGRHNTLLIGLKSLDSSGCAATNRTALGLVFRALPTETDSVTGRLLTQEYPNGITIGNYFYAYQKLNSSTCKASLPTLRSVDSAFTAAERETVTATTVTN